MTQIYAENKENFVIYSKTKTVEYWIKIVMWDNKIIEKNNPAEFKILNVVHDLNLHQT